MRYLRANFSNDLVQSICEDLHTKFLDLIAEFDYTVFKHMVIEDQTTIKGINVDKRDGVLTLSRRLVFKYSHSSYDSYHGNKVKETVRVNVHPRVRIINERAYQISIEMDVDGRSQSVVFNAIAGDEKYLINDDFHLKSEFESYVFQQSTVDSENAFDIMFVHEIIKSLRM